MKILPFEYSARNLGRSRLRLLMSVGGSAMVVLLVLAAAAFVRGMGSSLQQSGSDRNVILLGAGSEESIERSEIPPTAAGNVAAAIPGLAVTGGVPHVSPEVHVALPVSDHPDDDDARKQVLIRAVTPAATLVHPAMQVTDGHFPSPGRDELMIGRMVAEKIGLSKEAAAIGRTLYIDKKPWTIVGHFVAPGTVMDAEIWAPISDVKILTRRTTDSCVIVTLGTAEAGDIDAFCKQRLDLELSSLTEREYYASLEAFFGPVRAVAWATALLIGLGGALGGLNTMYAAFASRVRELGMLRCLGYRRAAIVLSLTQESLLATLSGSIIACVVGVLVFDGVSVRFSMGVFGLVIDSTAVLIALSSGLALGLVGALPPAWRSLQMSMPEALKAL